MLRAPAGGRFGSCDKKMRPVVRASLKKTLPADGNGGKSAYMSFQRAFQVARQLLTVVLAGSLGMTVLAASPADQASLVAANNQFSFDLMQQVVSAQTNANVFLSPFSAATALRMVANGAAGQTKQELEHTLHTGGLKGGISEEFSGLNHSLAGKKDVILTLAKGLWTRQGFTLKPAFVTENQHYFGAELATVDFNQPATAQIINDWASRQTHGKIPKLVEYPFDPSLRLFLANAIYFKGTWVKPFEKSATRSHDFHLPDRAVKQTPLMSRFEDLPYEETVSYQAVRLSYNGGLRMTIFLPATNQTPQTLLQTFDRPGIWAKNILPAFASRDGTLMLPKFKMEFAASLNTPLQTLGLKTAFSDSANFSGISDKQLCISDVFQKSFVEVNEQGTEAAAVTGIMFDSLSMPVKRPKPFEMIVDRPFLFTIEDEETNAILFIGVINNPETD